MIERPDADALMAGPLGAWLAQQDGARAEAKAKSRRYTTWGIIGAIPLALIAMAIFRDFEAGLGGAMVAFGIAPPL